MTSIYVGLGAEPWRPSASAEELLRLDFYNIPLAGILLEKTIEHDELYLYVCASGEEDDTNVWFYIPIDSDEMTALSEAGPDQLVGLMALCIRNKMITAALAQDWRIVSVAKVDAGEEPPGFVVQRVLRRLLGKFEHTTKNIEGLLHKSERETSGLLASA